MGFPEGDGGIWVMGWVLYIWVLVGAGRWRSILYIMLGSGGTGGSWLELGGWVIDLFDAMMRLWVSWACFYVIFVVL